MEGCTPEVRDDYPSGLLQSIHMTQVCEREWSGERVNTGNG